MLVELLFKLLFGLIDIIISLIPSFDFQIDLGMLNPVKEVFAFLDNAVSVSLILSILAIIFIRDNFTLIKNIFFAIVRKIPFVD
ncbi:hypothetical protein [Enterococcus termitis]|uniref:Uncharacterized protein n=1 Tax=Enterococcus termitis TaxID=332950 RepID=A0A1E5G7Z9_9ENTE|nr:hypothetical protein [Enterococcus termitis]OEG08828.1 hypothetical protein BCR25_12915 [Enterococcus termitis]OEG08838.1 hypothetical protein BCR25_12965 [Enterococcus termitis]OJG94713.1 hypothetical protein RV18_GL003189 [Enterococcus termitis]